MELKKYHQTWSFHCIQQAMTPLTLCLYVTTLPLILNGPRIQANQSSSAIAGYAKPCAETSMMKSCHIISVRLQFIFLFIYGSNFVYSITHEPDCSLKWTRPIMEDMAFFWHDIPSQSFNIAKYIPF